MRDTAVNPVTLVWLCLLVLTSVSIGLAHLPGLGAARALPTVLVIVIAFFKVRLIGLHFMELRTAPLALRLIFEFWLVAVCAGLLFLYLVRVGP